MIHSNDYRAGSQRRPGRELQAITTPFACWEYNITLMIQTLCCIGSGCLKTSCKPCVKCCGLTMSHSVKLAYFCFVALLVVVSLILKSSIHDPSAYVLQKTGCQDALQQNSCVFSQIVVRMFFCLSILFLVFALAMSLRNDKAKTLNEGVWLAKLIAFLALFGFSMLLGPAVVDLVYRSSLQTWLLFCLLQSLAIIDILWSFAIVIKERLEEGRSGILQAASFLLTAGGYCGAITLNVYSYSYLPKWLAVCNSVAIGLLFLVALVNVNPSNTILLSGTVLFYIEGLNYVLGVARQEISSYEYHWKLETLMITLLVLTLVSMLHRGSGKIKTPSSSFNQLLGMNTDKAEEAEYIATNNWRKFHLLMAVICISMPVVLTQWRHITQTGEDTLKEYLPKLYSGISVAAAYVLYIWSIVCIRCYPDRDLSELESYFKEFELN